MTPSAATTTTGNVTSTILRAVKKVLPAPRPHWVGNAFHVFPVFADHAFTESVSPLLMFDYAAPKSFPPQTGGAAPRGVGQHPHRGFETVTIAFQGEVEHKDSKGNNGVIQPGDIQWMTAGRGIVHQEYHSTEFTKKGGTFEMCQLWVNLPKKHKMVEPRYQPIVADKVPEVALEGGGTVRIIAGSLPLSDGKDGKCDEVHGPAKTFSPVQVWDVNIPKEASTIDLPFPSNHRCIVFVRRGGVDVLTSTNQGGDGECQANPLGPQDVAIMEDGVDGDGSVTTIRLRSAVDDTSVLILGGEPLNEPIAARGPFVMNTWDEITQANNDFRRGRMGQ